VGRSNNAICIEDSSMTPEDLFNSFTTREKTVFLMMVDSIPNKHMARLLGISTRTVEIYVRGVKTKIAKAQESVITYTA